MHRSYLALCLGAALAACGNSDPSFVLYAPTDIEPGAELAVLDIQDAFERLTGHSVKRASLPAPACSQDAVRIVYLGHQNLDRRESAQTSVPQGQDYSVVEERCDGGKRIVLRGGSLLSGQWAAYELLKLMGVRYFHPEQTLFPQSLLWPKKRIDVHQSPLFRGRSFNVHRTHPVELSAPLNPGKLDMAGYQRRWIDWSVRHRTTLASGHDTSLVGSYAHDRGFPRTAAINLLNTQQGGRPVIDPDDPRSEEEQIAEAIEYALRPVEGRPDAQRLSFQFNPSEVTEADDIDTVRRLTFISNYLSEHHPNVYQWCVNHGNAGQPTPNYGVPFFHLPQFTPTKLGVQVHTLMFYDLLRPAHVYGNHDFSSLLRFIRQEATRRRIQYYPEGSWWLTFDLPVPLYLAPATLEARQFDVNLLRDLIAMRDDAPNGVVEHHLFTSGQEWGYWLIDHCFAETSYEAGLSYADCVADFTSYLARGNEVLQVLNEVTARQIVDMRDPELVRFLVGSDDETELASGAGVEFHVLPPRPSDVLLWDDAKVAALSVTSLPLLRAMADDYYEWTARIEAVLAEQSETQAPWVREIRDGLHIFGLRAEHAAVVYETVLALRQALQDKSVPAIDVAYEGVTEARELTELARSVVRAREADYRYPPELTLVGDEPGTSGAIPNKTIYPYRYLSRTHRMFYWERPDKQLAELFGDGLELVQVNRRVLRLDQALDITLLVESPTAISINWGDGTEVNEVQPHNFAAHGFYNWVLDATFDGGVVHHEDQAAVVERRIAFKKGSLQVTQPPAAALINGLLPGLDIGVGNDGTAFMAVGRIDNSSAVAAHGSLQRRGWNGSASGPLDWDIQIADAGSITVFGATLTLADGVGPQSRDLTITGDLSPTDVVDMLVGVGGFDTEGGTEFVALILGYTVETLPQRVTFVIKAKGAED